MIGPFSLTPFFVHAFLKTRSLPSGVVLVDKDISLGKEYLVILNSQRKGIAFHTETREEIPVTFILGIDGSLHIRELLAIPYLDN